MKIEVCMGSSCFARGNNRNLQVIVKYLKDNELNRVISIDGGINEETVKEKLVSYKNDTPNLNLDKIEIEDSLEIIIPTQKELQDFPYDLESFGYRIYLSTNEPNVYHPDFAIEED